MELIVLAGPIILFVMVMAAFAIYKAVTVGNRLHSKFELWLNK